MAWRFAFGLLKLMAIIAMMIFGLLFFVFVVPVILVLGMIDEGLAARRMERMRDRRLRRVRG